MEARLASDVHENKCLPSKRPGSGPSDVAVDASSSLRIRLTLPASLRSRCSPSSPARARRLEGDVPRGGEEGEGDDEARRARLSAAVGVGVEAGERTARRSGDTTDGPGDEAYAEAEAEAEPKPKPVTPVTGGRWWLAAPNAGDACAPPKPAPKPAPNPAACVGWPNPKPRGDIVAGAPKPTMLGGCWVIGWAIADGRGG